MIRCITQDSTSLLYILPKIHKTPWATRPVVSCIGSEGEVLSKWLDNQLQKVVHLCPSYIKDNWQLLDELKNLGPLQKGTKIFTADATSMYTNIDTSHGLQVVFLWLSKHSHELPPGFPPIQAICRGIEIVMRNNVFQLNNTNWLQLQGTAMGTSVACVYATIYFSFHEETCLLTHKHLKPFFYRRFIDDALVIQLNATPAKHTSFMNAMASFSDGKNKSLQWTSTPLSDTVDFLDLTLTIDPTTRRITSNTYQKPMNLHLYLPANSAHPPSVLKGLIYGNVRRFWIQNSEKSKYREMISNFFIHLRNRGHDAEELQELFLTAARKLSKNKQLKASINEEDSLTKRVFFHVPFHPQQITSTSFQRLFKEKCAETLLLSTGKDGKTPINIDRMTVAYSRPQNVRDTICRTKLQQPEGDTVQDTIDKLNLAREAE
jgi:hypothetical protein